ncbi:MAG TPA: NADH-dependent [FeFe] hydrogenase, group A6 [candidate division Zixibacteria bacterium]|nr:NADH-dependent [FeFe] hydrogenase, group A6 [candidate division Zixibacteria bacterium]
MIDKNNMVTLTIDDRVVTVPAGTTILNAARELGIEIPTLCAMEHISHAPGACRVCVVEVDRARSLVASCVYPVAAGMRVRTNTSRVRKARRDIIEFMLSDHPADCNTCVKNGSCLLQKVAARLGVREIRFDREFTPAVRNIDNSSPALVRETDKCINCLRCVTVCAEVQGVHILTPEGRGFDCRIVPAMGAKLADTDCTYCGQCAVVCPTGAIVEKDDTDLVWAALEDPKKHVVVQAAPAIRASLGEELGLPAGSLVTGKMITAFRAMKFDRVFDTNFAADLTIVEEGNELLARIESGGTLPMITSCCPGWIRFAEHTYPDLLGHISTCKSPQQMFGALAKSYYAQVAGIDPSEIFVVSIMPCTAKKFEITRPEMNSSGYRDVDAVLTTRELGRMIRQMGLDFATLESSEYDPPMGEYTGAATIFGATGGVMEAALRTVYAVVTGSNMPKLDVEPVRGLEGIKAATIEVGKLGPVKVAVAHGLANARKVLDQIVAGESEYHFIEIMACPGGCVGGGGQPLPVNVSKLRARSNALYRDDAEVQELRQSHENPSLSEAYRKFLKEPNSEVAHHYLHTSYKPARPMDAEPLEGDKESWIATH